MDFLVTRLAQTKIDLMIFIVLVKNKPSLVINELRAADELKAIGQTFIHNILYCINISDLGF